MSEDSLTEERKERWKELASCALSWSVPDWSHLNASDSAVVESLTALLFVRIVAIHAPTGTFTDLSTSTICRSLRLEETHIYNLVSPNISDQCLDELRLFVERLLPTLELPYHSKQHSLQIALNANKLVDMMLSKVSPLVNSKGKQQRPTFGIHRDPLALLALTLASIVAQCDHQGVANKQLVNESHSWALQYNDTNVQQQRSLHVAFTALNGFQALKSCLCSTDNDYRYLRQVLVSLVLGTDLECPIRAEIFHSKWKESFKAVTNQVRPNASSPRRSSISSNISMPRAVQSKPNRTERRNSTSSILSDVTLDSEEWDQKRMQVDQHNARFRRRASNQSEFSIYSEYANDSVMLQHKQPKQKNPTETSLAGSTSEYGPTTGGSSHESFASIAADSVRLAQRRSQRPAISSPSNARQPRRVDSDDNLYYGRPGTPFDDDSSDGSFTLTPPSSDDEMDGVVISGVTLSRSMDEDNRPVSSPRRGIMQHKSNEEFPDPRIHAAVGRRTAYRRASTGNHSVKLGPSLQGSRIDEETTNDKATFRSRDNGNTLPVVNIKRLSIRRSMDFSGESLEVYSRKSNHTSEELNNGGVDFDMPDDLKASVVLELILRIAKVGHYLQSWDNFVEWTVKLHREMSASHASGRGPDPSNGWFDHQIKLMEQYVLPLAQKLTDIGVFREPFLIAGIELNRDQWLLDGIDIIQSL